MFDDEKDKWGFTNINMDTIVGTDVPGGPRKNERFAHNYVDECVLFNKFTT